MKTRATDNVIGKTETYIQSFRDHSDVSLDENVLALWTKALCCNQVHTKCSLKGIFIEGLSESIRERTLSYCSANRTGTLYDLTRFTTSFKILQGKTHNGDELAKNHNLPGRVFATVTATESIRLVMCPLPLRHQLCPRLVFRDLARPGTLIHTPCNKMGLVPLAEPTVIPVDYHLHCRQDAVLLHLPQHKSPDIHTPDRVTGYSWQFDQYLRPNKLCVITHGPIGSVLLRSKPLTDGSTHPVRQYYNHYQSVAICTISFATATNSTTGCTADSYKSSIA